MKKILNRASSKPQMRKESSKCASSNKKYCPNPINITGKSHETAILRDGPNINDVPKSAPDIRNRSSWRASVKSQIFVRINNLQVITINIDLFTCADNLQRVLTQELGEKAEDYNITFGSKELDKDKTLFEQKIYHGTTVDLHVRLHGGKGKKKTKKKLNQQKKKHDNIAVTHEDIASKHSSLTLGSIKVEDIEEDVDKESEHELLQASRNDISGTFGKLPNLDSIRGLLILEDISNDGKSPTPEFGSVVSVKGICERKESFGNNATLIIRDDPQGASSISYKMKIVICSNEKSVNLKISNIEKLLEDVRKEVQVAVMGRVERLESESNDTKDPHCEMIRFKLVVDSDKHHGFVYVERIRPKYTRQLSQPWWISENGDSSSRFLNLKKGDRIGKTAQRIFLQSAASDDEILNYVVALKNSYDGDILVGVDTNGVVTGIKSDAGEIAKRREDLSNAMTSILPESKEGADICFTLEEACNCVNGKKCFVCVLPLSTSGKSEIDQHYIVWIHVPQGETEPLYFRAEKNVHAYIRKGAQNKRITNYKEFFSSLYSLGSRPKPKEISEEDLDIEIKFKESIGETGLRKNYKVLEQIRYENQNWEFKMIFGCDPVKTIVDKYLTEYTCGFLNASGGTILFGVQEGNLKLGHVVGIVISLQKRKELVQKAVTALSKFYPPVLKSQFRLIFHKVIVPQQLVSVVKNEQPNKDCTDSFLLLQGPPGEIGNKWPKFVKDKLRDCLSRVIPLKPELNSQNQRFCIVVENRHNIEERFEDNLNGFLKQNPKITRNSITEDELKQSLKQLYMIELKIFPSQYPIHLTKTVETHVFDTKNNLVELSIEGLMNRFKFGKDATTTFDVDKFLNDVENFEQSGNSYILITSPFNLPTTERDLHGLVLPQWTLVIDFDQHLKQEGHLYQRFKELYDVLQIQRKRFIKTPRDTKLGLNPEHAICWLAVRGYDEVEKTLSKEGHGNWNITHRNSLSTLLMPELARFVRPNYLNIIVLWDDGHKPLIDSLRTILEDIISITGYRTAVTFVCSNETVRLDINEVLVEPLQNSYWRIFSTDRVYIAQPYVLSRHLSANLPSPYQPEDDYQVPHRKKVRGKYQTWPDILPKTLRHNNYLKVMYIRKRKELDKRILDKERKKFYSGLEITDLGLQNEFGIEREKMEELDKEFKLVCNDFNDRRSHVAILCLKVDRGAGSSTLCLQFLFKHHKEYPCAQLLEIGEDLLSYIREINNATKLPLLLFVDEEISHPQDFLDFSRKLGECRNVNVILLLIVPAEAKRYANNTRIKNVADLSTLRTCPLKVIELRRDLTEREMTNLTNHLVDIRKEKNVFEKIEKLKNKAKSEKTALTFAHFGLTVFGKDFFGLNQFVKFRLNIADEKQRAVLSYLSLIHIYTESTLPASALSAFLEEKKTVNLEDEFQDDYVRELLSPPVDNTDSRRISFHEVAEEILAQLASAKSFGSANKQTYWQFIKDVAVDLAKQVLSVNIATKAIDRLTRRLFVTSEYESEKFSSLIRAMKDGDRDIARDTLTELKDIFQKPSSFRAHILAHLAKYYMIVAKDFEEAKPRIEEAIKDQPDDPLLRHIHGDIILRHVKALKKTSKVDMDSIVSFAEESSESFKFVRRKRPNDSHGYMSDAMVRITVMQAATKHKACLQDNSKRDNNFIDYLLDRLNDIRSRGDRIITKQERYLISLIPKAHAFLYESVSDDYEHKDEWKMQFRKCIGEQLSNLRVLCGKIREVKSVFHDFRDENSIWLHKVLLNIQKLNNGFEIDDGNLTEDQIEERIKEIEECAKGLKYPEPLMMFWLRYSRNKKIIPRLEDVKKKVKDWLHISRKKKSSPNAEFYNYVVNMLIALQDPNDREKREKVEKIQQEKKYKKDNVIIPQEWLDPKDGHHINSIDSLLHHDDLVKENDGNLRTKQQRREVIEGYLSLKGGRGVTRWKGTVTDVQKLWIGTITFKKHFEVRFIPQSVQTGLPKSGDTVSFCLGFDRLGLSAWWVRLEEGGSEPLEGVKTFPNINGYESSSDKEENGSEEIPRTNSFKSSYSGQIGKTWNSRNGERLQGVVVSTNSEKGFGYLERPDVDDKLFFHALQLVQPVIALKGSIEKHMVLEFRVEEVSAEKTRASDINVIAEENVHPKIAKFRRAKIEENSSPSIVRRHIKPRVNKPRSEAHTCREKGVVVGHSKEKTFGFIKADKKSFSQDIFFHRERLAAGGSLPNIGQRVEFSFIRTKRGLKATQVWIENEANSPRRPTPDKEQTWGSLGIVESVSDGYGYIVSNNHSGSQDRMKFTQNDIQNGRFQDIIENTKVYYEVGKRGGRLIAKNVNIIA
ncbi:uncharacterized protein LOC114534715 [Dendronephthya gigantea]|uniref:uncharacterized protein LOC114534715 n=1 Tax=Dendronephthya gigantea TaxID=151771 RepID=UPI00106CCA46|nr:uncharacterized protein LOC114534715 [Dendronephthya gigantea]